MRITKSILKKIIKEEILRESSYMGFEEKPPPLERGFRNVGIDDDRLAQIRKVISEPLKKIPYPPNVIDAEGHGGRIYKHILTPTEQVITRMELDYIISNDALEKFNLDNVNFSGIDLSGLDFSEAYMNGSNFSGASLIGTTMKETQLGDSNFSKSNLSKANLAGAWLADAKLVGALLADANLRNADGIRADLSNANLTGADLKYANLRGADLSGADLTGANLKYANLRNVEYDSETIFPEGFDRSALEGSEQ